MRNVIIISLSVLSIESATPSECWQISKVDASGPKVRACGQSIFVGDTCRYSFLVPQSSIEIIGELSDIPNIDCKSLKEAVPANINTNMIDAVVKIFWDETYPTMLLSCKMKGPGGSKSLIGYVEQRLEKKDGTPIKKSVFASIIVETLKDSNAFSYLSSLIPDPFNQKKRRRTFCGGYR